MIIGLTGYARSGKDTVARMLAEEENGVVERVGFSDLLKLSAARALNVLTSPDDVGMKPVQEWADDFKTRHTIQIRDESGRVVHEIPGRTFLQRYGTEAHRELFGDDFWVEAVDLDRPGVDLVVVNDVRFANEAERIREAGGEIWQVVRAGAEPAGSHVTERPLPGDLIDREVPNHGTLDDLRGHIQSALVAIKSQA